MLQIMKNVTDPSVSYSNKLFYLTSVRVNHSTSSDPGVVVDHIMNLLASSNNRYLGMQTLELALQQNSDISSKGRWNGILYDTLKNPGASIMKEQSCKVLSLLIPCMAKDPLVPLSDSTTFIKSLFSILLKKVDENVEWADAAGACMYACLQNFPQALVSFRDSLLVVILRRVSKDISFKSFEIIADCFCELPHIARETNKSAYQERWKTQYYKVLKTLQSLTLFFQLPSESIESLRDIPADEYQFEEESLEPEFFPDFMTNVRRFINMCKCLAKMLSTKTKYFVSFHASLAFHVLSPYYKMPTVKSLTLEMEVLLSSMAQIQLAGLCVIESLILNCNLLSHMSQVTNLIRSALKCCISYGSVESLSALRFALWKVLHTWLSRHGEKVSIHWLRNTDVLHQIFEDIDIEVKESPQTANINKSKKSNISKSSLLKKDKKMACKEALNALEVLMLAGAKFMVGRLKDFYIKFFEICDAVGKMCNTFPFPYDDESCREKLYSVLLSIVRSQPDEMDVLQRAQAVFERAQGDPSPQVNNIVRGGDAIYYLLVHPKRPPLSSGSGGRHRQLHDERERYNDFSREHYIPGLKLDSESEPEDIGDENETQSFRNEVVINSVNSEEYMEVEPHYSGQRDENQCNGEEVLEIQNSSQGQDDMDSDEEDEEDDEERSDEEDDEVEEEEGEEDKELEQENMYVRNSRNLQPLNPVHASTESIENEEQEYEELKPRVPENERLRDTESPKTYPLEVIEEGEVVIKPCSEEASGTDDKSMNIEINGICSVLPHEGPSSSAEVVVANENGIHEVEVLDDDDDIDEEEEEEEDKKRSSPDEKNIESCNEPPHKRQRFDEDDDEVNEEMQDEEREENSRLRQNSISEENFQSEQNYHSEQMPRTPSQSPPQSPQSAESPEMVPLKVDLDSTDNLEDVNS